MMSLAGVQMSTIGSPCGSPAWNLLASRMRKLLSSSLSGRLLRAAGFDVEAFSSGRQFLDQHDPQIPGCAVLDVGMEELDGLSLQQALSAGGAMRPVIFLTGCDDVTTTVRAMKAGAVDYLTKPVQDETLIAAVRIALDYDARARAQRLDPCLPRALRAIIISLPISKFRANSSPAGPATPIRVPPPAHRFTPCRTRISRISTVSMATC